jgi:hypothetical protein
MKGGGAARLAILGATGIEVAHSRPKKDLIQHQLLAKYRLAGSVCPFGWNTVFTRSSPNLIISDMTVLLCGSSQTHPGKLRPSGGGHIIRALSVSQPEIRPEKQDHFNRSVRGINGVRYFEEPLQ